MGDWVQPAVSTVAPAVGILVAANGPGRDEGWRGSYLDLNTAPTTGSNPVLTESALTPLKPRACHLPWRNQLESNDST